MTGPIPKMSVSVVPDAATASPMRRSDCLIWRLEAGDVSGELGDQVLAQPADWISRCHGGKELPGVGRVEPLGDSPW